MFNLRKILFVLFTCVAFFVNAGVNTKNGNFYISYTDLIVPDNSMIKITRTYNSKSSKLGLFGHGWGSNYETFLKINNDGTITVHENGSGRLTVYYPKSDLNADSKKASVEIAEVYKRANHFGSQNDYDLFVNRLNKDGETRNSYLKYVSNNGMVKTVSIPINSRLDSKYGNYIIRTANGYSRYSQSEIETFDESGFLVEARIGTRSVQIRRTPKGKIIEMVDNNNYHAQFFNNADGTLREIHFKQVKTYYKYDKKRLIESYDTQGNIFKYTYDDKNNMLGIQYVDGTSMRITYDKKTLYTTSLINRVGHLTEYIYADKNDLEYGTTIRYTKGKKVSEDKVWYVNKIGKGGYNYTAKIQRNNKNGTTIQLFDQDQDVHLCSEITINGNKVSYQYKDGFIKQKKSENDTETYIKNNSFKKISEAKKTDIKTSKIIKRQFAYDTKKRLLSVLSTDGDKVALSYGDSHVQTISINELPIVFIFEKDELISINYQNQKIYLNELSKISPDVLIHLEKTLINFMQLVNYPKPVCTNFDTHNNFKIFDDSNSIETLLIELSKYTMDKKSGDDFYKIAMTYTHDGLFSGDYSTTKTNLMIKAKVRGSKEAAKWCQTEILFLNNIQEEIVNEYLLNNQFNDAEIVYAKRLENALPTEKESIATFHWFCQVRQNKQSNKYIENYLNNLTWKTNRFSLKKLRYINDIISEKVLLEQAKNDQDKMESHFVIATKALAQGDKDKAKVFFTKVINTNEVTNMVHKLATAYLKKR